MAGAAVVVHDDDPVSAAPRDDIITAALLDDEPDVSRSAERAPLPSEFKAEEQVKDTMFVVAPIEVHAGSADSSPVLASIDEGGTVDVTGKTDGDWTQIVHKGLPRWVATKSLSAQEPPEPLGTAPCALGSAVESGLQPDTIRVHRAVCAAFPQVTRYGGRSGGGEHASGRAIDIMISSDSGTQIAEFARSHWRELGVSQVIWRQHIWTVQRSGDGWRPMSDRGGATANHYDHVHVTTFGSSGTG